MQHPIITRELLGMLRTRKAVALQVTLVVVLAMLVILRWPSDAMVNTSGFQAQQVLRVFGYGLMAAVVLLAPVFPATSIVRERQGGTLALLLNSTMSPASILIGKLVGSMGFIAILLVLSLPAAAASYTMGGVGLGQVLLVYLIIFVAALQYGSIALYVSSRATTADSSLRITFGLILAFAILPLVLAQFIPADEPIPFGVAAFFGEYLGKVPGWAEQQEFELFEMLPQGLVSLVYTVILYVVVIVTWLSRFFTPAPAMTALLHDEALFSVETMSSGGVVWRYIIFAIVCSLFFLWLTARRLRPDALDRARDAGKVTDERTGGVQAMRRVLYMWYFDPQRRASAIGWANPVMMKEFRSRRFGRRHWMVRLFFACIVVSIGLMFAMTEKEGRVERVVPILVLLQTALLVLIAPALSAGLISSERESGGWTLLQMTPLPAWRIVAGKLLSVLMTLALILLATLPGYFVVLFIGAPEAAEGEAGGIPLVSKFVHVVKTSPHTAQIAGIQLALLAIAVFAVLLGAMCSALFKRTAAATAATYTVLGVLCMGTMLVRFAEDSPFSHGFVERVLTVNPLAAVLARIQAPLFEDYPLVVAWNPWIMGAASVLCLIVLIARTRALTKPQ